MIFPRQAAHGAQDDPEAGGLAGLRREVVESAGNTEGHAHGPEDHRGDVGGDGADLARGRAVVAVQLRHGALLRCRGVAHHARWQVHREVLDVGGGVGERDVNREVAVGARLVGGRRGGKAGHARTRPRRRRGQARPRPARSARRERSEPPAVPLVSTSMPVTALSTIIISERCPLTSTGAPMATRSRSSRASRTTP